MIRTVDSRALGSAFLLVALLLRASIPSGYMPASPGTGLLFELCPEGMPARLFASADGHHHPHAHHADDGSADSEGGGADQCPIGHMLTPAAAVDHAWQPDHRETPEMPARPAIVSADTRTSVARRSRGPPA